MYVVTRPRSALVRLGEQGVGTAGASLSPEGPWNRFQKAWCLQNPVGGDQSASVCKEWGNHNNEKCGLRRN